MNTILGYFLLALVLIVNVVVSYDNGLARTPPMGFNTWNQFGCNVNEDNIRKTIDSMVFLGLRDLGYHYVNIDDCWSLMERDPHTKRMVSDPEKFPSGMKALSDYAHSKGMKLGIYSDLGEKTCQGYPGSADHYEIDAQTFADWGIDYLKLDFCHTSQDQKDKPWIDYSTMSKALNATGRPIVFSICNWGVHEPWKWAPKIANLWRTTGDIQPKWDSVMSLSDQNKKLFPFAGKNNWNDPDMLEVGVVVGENKLTRAQAKAHFSLWAMMAAPLLLGNDLRDPTTIEPWVLDIISNREIIAVDQDSLGLQGVMVEENIIGLDDKYNCKLSDCTRTETWMKPLSGGGFAVMLFNRGGKDASDSKFRPEVMRIDWSKHLKVDPGTKFLVKDLWSRRHLGVFTQQLTYGTIPVHDVLVLKLSRYSK